MKGTKHESKEIHNFLILEFIFLPNPKYEYQTFSTILKAFRSKIYTSGKISSYFMTEFVENIPINDFALYISEILKFLKSQKILNLNLMKENIISNKCIAISEKCLIEGKSKIQKVISNIDKDFDLSKLKNKLEIILSEIIYDYKDQASSYQERISKSVLNSLKFKIEEELNQALNSLAIEYLNFVFEKLSKEIKILKENSVNNTKGIENFKSVQMQISKKIDDTKITFKNQIEISKGNMIIFDTTSIWICYEEKINEIFKDISIKFMNFFADSLQFTFQEQFKKDCIAKLVIMDSQSYENIKKNFICIMEDLRLEIITILTNFFKKDNDFIIDFLKTFFKKMYGYSKETLDKYSENFSQLCINRCQTALSINQGKKNITNNDSILDNDKIINELQNFNLLLSLYSKYPLFDFSSSSQINNIQESSILINEEGFENFISIEKKEMLIKEVRDRIPLISINFSSSNSYFWNSKNRLEIIFFFLLLFSISIKKFSGLNLLSNFIMISVDNNSIVFDVLSFLINVILMILTLLVYSGLKGIILKLRKLYRFIFRKNNII